MSVLALLLFLISGVALLGGLATLTQVTQGVGGIAIACYLAIVARLAQASGHQDAQRDLLRTLLKKTQPSATEPSPAVHFEAKFASTERQAAQERQSKMVRRILFIVLAIGACLLVASMVLQALYPDLFTPTLR